MSTRPDFSPVVRRARQKLRLTQSELARATRLYRTTVSHYERGSQALSTRTQLRLLLALEGERRRMVKEFAAMDIPRSTDAD